MSHRFIPAYAVARVFAIGLFCLITAASVASGQPGKDPSIEPLDFVSRNKLIDQREIVSTLARRHVGSRLSGNLSNDLRILQRLFDRYPTRDRRLVPFKGRAVSDNERIYEIQALGVALGDLLARNFELEWVVFEDEYGRGRALNVKGTKDIVFPVTMLSKRYEVALPVDVKAIYDEVAAELSLSLKPEKPTRPKLPPRPRLLDD